MNAAEFRAAWEASGDQLRQHPANAVSVNRLPEDTKRFLEAAGLPQDAAPFLSFSPGTLDWIRQPGDDLGCFYALGFDGSGNPFAVDEDGVVWLIDHENPHIRTLVNSSVASLAGCLLAYRSMVAETISIGGEDAFLEGYIPRHAIEAFSRSVSNVDSKASGSGTFWGQELARLMAEATG
jgi:hypothetical protein